MRAARFVTLVVVAGCGSAPPPPAPRIASGTGSAHVAPEVPAVAAAPSKCVPAGTFGVPIVVPDDAGVTFCLRAGGPEVSEEDAPPPSCARLSYADGRYAEAAEPKPAPSTAPQPKSAITYEATRDGVRFCTSAKKCVKAAVPRATSDTPLDTSYSVTTSPDERQALVTRPELRSYFLVDTATGKVVRKLGLPEYGEPFCNDNGMFLGDMLILWTGNCMGDERAFVVHDGKPVGPFPEGLDPVATVPPELDDHHWVFADVEGRGIAILDGQTHAFRAISLEPGEDQPDPCEDGPCNELRIRDINGTLAKHGGKLVVVSRRGVFVVDPDPALPAAKAIKSFPFTYCP